MKPTFLGDKWRIPSPPAELRDLAIGSYKENLSGEEHKRESRRIPFFTEALLALTVLLLAISAQLLATPPVVFPTKQIVNQQIPEEIGVSYISTAADWVKDRRSTFYPSNFLLNLEE
jgi:hypothetical protein